MTMQKFQPYSLVLEPNALVFENVNYLGDDLWAAFKNFYLFCLSNRHLVEYYNQPLPQDLVRASHQYFHAIKAGSEDIDQGAMADKYFENFTPIWNSSGQRNKNLWYVVLKMVREWEEQNNFELHKGTPFYFWATTDILHGDYDEGFILMHKALDEDRRKSGGAALNTPGYGFVAMNENQAAYLQRLTANMADFVKRRLEKYNERGGKLNYEDFRKKFLDTPDRKFEELKFFFTYATLRWIRLRQIHKERNIADDKMAPLIFTGVISDLLLVWENLLRIWSGDTKGMLKDWIRPFTKKLGVRDIDLRTVNKDRDNDFSAWLSGNLNKTVREDIIIGYGLRNFSAHTLESQKVLWEEFTDVLQSVMNCLFVVIEKLK